MECIKGIEKLTFSLSHPVVTIGNFDGVHRGHQEIIRLAVQKAKARGGQSLAYTFRPHPQVALHPESKTPLWMTYDEKLEMMGQLGLDIIIEEPFSHQFSKTEPKQFFTDILMHRIGAEAIVVGYDFAFGRERHGHLEALTGFCQESGVELTVVHPQKVEGEVVSSSKIRHYLQTGQISIANKLLGREFFYRGIVVHGDARGRKIGFPTANLKIEGQLALPFGVYATWTVVHGKQYPSVTNIGRRPTFESDGTATVETHLFDMKETDINHINLDLYGSRLEVRFVEHLREEQRFPSVDALQSQIAKDLAESRKALRAR